MTGTAHQPPAPPDLELLEEGRRLLADPQPECSSWLAARKEWELRYRAYLAGRTRENVTIPDLAELGCESFRIAMGPTTDRVLPYSLIRPEQRAGWRAVGAGIWAACWTAWQRRQGGPVEGEAGR